jgi:tetratricopeptide (TPR) repeat protein
MHAERGYLQDQVFPELSERLRARSYHLEAIDLRWGVETVSVDEERAKALLVLKVCLAEIERSRPFLIALIGDRYGWVPTTERVHAAAAEAGFAGDTTGKSITALEIEYAALTSPGQRPRCRFYFRDPLPYDQMPPEVAARYSDLHSGLPGATEADRRLQDLKSRIEREMSGRVRRYQAQWDVVDNKVTGLEQWGHQVIEDLWHDLEEETREFAAQPRAGWQQEEAFVLEQFAETQCRDFVGREDILKVLLAEAESAASLDATWGLCVVGSSGSGKSSLFAELFRRFQKQDVLLLAHAAGISTRSSQVDAILRRWTAELAGHLKVADPCATITEREALQKALAELLSRAAANRRVVCIIDALNQFESTPTARHLTWLPESWPANARLIATAIPGVQSDALSKRRGIRTVTLPLLNKAEAAQIAVTVSGRYHKKLHPEIMAALTSKELDGKPSAGYPLWLVLALEQLLLLDADDFERAEDRPGTPEERLHGLLLEVVGGLPPAIDALYEYLLQRAERVYGEDLARTFVNLVAVSRSGWRESDLRALIPAVSGEPWSPLGFAALRRGFRAHLVQRGVAAQWDFFHVQARVAVFHRNLKDPAQVRQLHSRIADHLESLPPDDPLCQTEMMAHLMGARDGQRGARFYSDSVRSAEKTSATGTLADAITAGATAKPNPGLQWAESLLERAADDAALHIIANRYLFFLDNKLRDGADLDTRLSLVRMVLAAIQGLSQRAPQDAEYARDDAVCHAKLGDLHLAMGEPIPAVERYRQAVALTESALRLAPLNVEWKRDLAVSYNRLGDVSVRLLREPSRGREEYERAARILDELRRAEPKNADYDRDLAVTHHHLGDVYVKLGQLEQAKAHYESFRDISEMQWRQDRRAESADAFGVSCAKLGDLWLGLGQPLRALEHYNKSKTVSQLLRRSSPEVTGYIRGTYVCCNKLGSVYLQLGESAKALEEYEEALVLTEELHHRVPDNAEFERDLGACHNRLGNFWMRTGELQRAQVQYELMLARTEALYRRAREVPEYVRDLSVSHTKLGEVYGDLGKPTEARRQFEDALALGEEALRQSALNPECIRDVSVILNKLGDLCATLGEPDKSIDYYRRTVALCEQLRRLAPLNAQYAKNLIGYYYKLSAFFHGAGDATESMRYRARCIEAMRTARAAGLHLDPALTELVASLDNSASDHR